MNIMSRIFIEYAPSLRQSLAVIIGNKGALNCGLKGNRRLKSQLNFGKLWKQLLDSKKLKSKGFEKTSCLLTC